MVHQGLFPVEESLNGLRLVLRPKLNINEKHRLSAGG